MNSKVLRTFKNGKGNGAGALGGGDGSSIGGRGGGDVVVINLTMLPKL
jgi:hypothetical protein